MIRKEDAEVSISETEAEALKIAENLVDSKIRQWSHSGTVYVDLSSVSGMSRRVGVAMVDLYQVGGWTARFDTGDQREPGYTLVLS